MLVSEPPHQSSSSSESSLAIAVRDFIICNDFFSSATGALLGVSSIVNLNDSGV
jgi:hypothetical protein